MAPRKVGDKFYELVDIDMDVDGPTCDGCAAYDTDIELDLCTPNNGCMPLVGSWKIWKEVKCST